MTRSTAPQLGDRVRWTKRAGRYYFWDAADVPASGDPFDDAPESPWVTSKDGIPQLERERIIERLSCDDDARAMDGYNINHGSNDIHVWDESGEGILIGKTSRTTFERLTDEHDPDARFVGMNMASGKTTQFWEVRTSLRGRRIIIPLDALETAHA